jgi:hypothetical protein
MLLAIDPGMNSPGVALFDTSFLRAAGALEIPLEWIALEPGERWMNVALEIAAWTRNALGGIFMPVVRTVVFEKPQWYARSKSKVDPNQLVGIAGVAANVTGMLQPGKVRTPTPAEWIGQLPKVCPVCDGRKTTKVAGKRVKRACEECKGSAWETPRGRFIRSRLEPGELKLVPDQNDAIDAVGLGLWALGRLKPRSVFSNGRDGR